MRLSGVQRQVKREINLSPEQVKAILSEAKAASLRDHLLLKTMTVGDFRVGEVVGSAGRRWVKETRSWTPPDPSQHAHQDEYLKFLSSGLNRWRGLMGKKAGYLNVSWFMLEVSEDPR